VTTAAGIYQGLAGLGIALVGGMGRCGNQRDEGQRACK